MIRKISGKTKPPSYNHLNHTGEEKNQQVNLI